VTTTTVVSGEALIAAVAARCSVPPALVYGDQIVLDTGASHLVDLDLPDQEVNELLFAASCVGRDVVSPAGQAVLGTASGNSGPVTVTEAGLTFTQIYNQGTYVNILTVTVAA